MIDDVAPVAVVTGAAEGLGAHIVDALLSAGYRVAATDLGDVSAARLAARLDPGGSRVIGHALDVREKRAFEDVLGRVVDEWGRVDVLVNNAAVTLTTPALQISAAEFDTVIGVNLKGVLFGSQVFGEYFARRNYGRIINMASLAGQNDGTASGAHYAASKAGIIALTKVFAREFANARVTVNAVAPGPLDLASVRRAVGDRLDALRGQIPVGVLGDPAFVAGMVVHLASPEAASVTGATWDANGGLFMR